MLARKGWLKSPAQTPAEFLICIQNNAIREPFAKFTQHYESARFGGSAEDAQRLPDLYEEFRGKLVASLDNSDQCLLPEALKDQTGYLSCKALAHSPAAALGNLQMRGALLSLCRRGGLW